MPVGHSVSIDGATHLSYRWDGTKAVPGVPARPERKVEIIAGWGGQRVLLIAINLGLVLVLIVVLWSKRATT